MDKKQLEETIARHKKQGIQTYTLTCESGEQCLIKAPNVETTNKVLVYLHGAVENKDMLKAGKIIIQDGWIAGDDLIRKDMELMGEVAFAAATLCELKVADVKKN
jgi:hypothetical protein